MNRKTAAVLMEIIPILSAAVSFPLILSAYNSALIQRVISITMLLAFLGFLFFIIGRKLAKEDKLVRILGVLDLLATVCVVVFYILAIFSFGL
jgi:hypothetical protein